MVRTPGNCSADMTDLASNSLSVNIFPDPSGRNFTVILSGTEGPSSETFIEILIAQGEKIYFSKINSTQTDIALNHPARGIYFIKIHTEKGSIAKKLFFCK
jgi:hypothetical protein